MKKKNLHRKKIELKVRQSQKRLLLNKRKSIIIHKLLVNSKKIKKLQNLHELQQQKTYLTHFCIKLQLKAVQMCRVIGHVFWLILLLTFKRIHENGLFTCYTIPFTCQSQVWSVIRKKGSIKRPLYTWMKNIDLFSLFSFVPTQTVLKCL